MLTILFFLALGVLSDILIVRYYQAISDREVLWGSALAFFIPILSFGVLERALSTHSWGYILAFCAGNGIGTAYQLRRR
jgi:hypothetical protein